MTSCLPFQDQSLTGWGRTDATTARVVSPSDTEQIKILLQGASPHSVIPRGLGRAYGNPAQCEAGTVINLEHFDHIQLDVASGTALAGGGTSLDTILQSIVPAGFFLPVTPGTRFVTVGGAIAADVHGKNHHREGSFARHVEEIRLLDGEGQEQNLRPDDPSTASAFWATCGGMGLTGVIIEARFRLIPIETALISVDTERYGDLDSLMTAMVEGDKHYRYSVAWVDSLHGPGRGVLTRGDHANLDQWEAASSSGHGPLHYDPKALASAPSLLPGGLLNNWTVRAFNEAWFRKAPRKREGELQAITPFFHPLDGVNNWNRIYGPSGFLQYQFVVPDHAGDLVGRCLAALRKIGAPSFLTVLKRFGDATPGPLSFPMPGWTLAADVPAAVPGLMETLDHLDQHVADAGGRLYLAKDSRQSAAMFATTYPALELWKQERSRLDPRHIFQSDLSRRLAI